MATKKATGSQKLYRNAGVTELVLEDKVMEPGSKFLASLSPEQEIQFLQGGHIEILQDQSARADQAQAQAAEDGVESVSASVNESSRRKR